MHLVQHESFFREVIFETLSKRNTSCRMQYGEELKLLDERYLQAMQAAS